MMAWVMMAWVGSPRMWCGHGGRGEWTGVPGGWWRRQDRTPGTSGRGACVSSGAHGQAASPLDPIAMNF